MIPRALQILMVVALSGSSVVTAQSLNISPGGGNPFAQQPATPPAVTMPPTPPETAKPQEATKIPSPVVQSSPEPIPPPEQFFPLAPSTSGVTSMNPDISAIMDAVGGFWQRRPLSLAGDDPELGGSPHDPGGAFTLQEAEVAFQSNIDPYLHGDVFLTIPNTGNLEVEEAYLTTTSLPGDLQIKAGVFRAGLGRQNAQHLHLQDFTMRPLINQTFLGVDGLRAPGVEVNWLMPVPFYSLLILEGLAPEKASDPLAPIATFGGGAKGEVAGVAAWKLFFNLSDDVSAYWGLNYTRGRSSRAADPVTGLALGNNLRTQLYGSDLYIKYKPANQSGGFHSLALQTEYFQRKFDGDDVVRTQFDGGLYTQLVWQLAQRWFWGFRYDKLGLPENDFTKSAERYGTSLTFVPSEFSRVRLYGMNEVLSGSNYPGSTPLSSTAVMIQLEAAMGAHGAHPF